MEALRQKETSHRLVRWAWGLWLALLAVVCVRPVLAPAKNTVYPIYVQAAHNWSAGAEMYGRDRGPPGQDLFRYAPVFAVAMLPFQYLGAAFGEPLWRLLGAGCYLLGFVGFVREFMGRIWDRSDAMRAVMLLAIVPLSLGSLNNGQVNVHMAGMLLLATAAVAQRRWNAATLCLAIGVFCKLYPLALTLLFIVMYPRALGWRLLLAMSVGLAVPFLTQTPSYVAGEYQQWLATLQENNRRDLPVGQGLRDLEMLLRWCGWYPSRGAYLTLQMTGAAALAMFARMDRRHATEREHLRLVFDLACCWMIVLGPATESSTYILLAPTLACAVAERRMPWLLGSALTLFLIAVVGTGMGWPKDLMGIAQISGAVYLCLVRLAGIPHSVQKEAPHAAG